MARPPVLTLIDEFGIGGRVVDAEFSSAAWVRHQSKICFAVVPGRR